MSHTRVEEPVDPPPTDDSPLGSDVRDQPRKSAWARWRPLAIRLHSYAGLFVAPFVLVAACTGLLYALIPQIDKLVNRHELTVDHVGEHRLPLTGQLAAVRAAHPDGTVQSIRLPAAANETTQVRLAVGDVPPDYARTVFVDPYTGQVRGALTMYGQWMPLRAWFDEFYRDLHLGAVGRNYSELAASWVWVVAGAGVLLWIGHRRGAGKLRRLATPDTGVSGRRRLMSWHAVLGVWIIPALLLLSISGMTWSRFAGAHVSEIRSHLTWSTPAVDTTLPGSAFAQAPGAPHVDEASALPGADIALRAAHDAHLSDPIWMYPPYGVGQGWRVVEHKRDWPTRHDATAVDPDTGAVTARVNFADWPFMAKLADWIVGTHLGILLGVVNQALLAAVPVGLITMILLGYRMWWRRRLTRGPGFPLPGGPRRGALAQVRPHEAVMVVVCLAAFGWFAPLFGLSLAAFVAVDVALGWWKSRPRTQDQHR